MEKLKIVILQTSDIHGNIYPLQYGTNERADLGLGKIATLIKRERQKNKHTILIDNGDLIQGTPLTYHYVRFQSHLPNPMVTIANALQYDVAVLGNHEFNYGPTILSAAVKESTFPWLAANILNKCREPFFGTPYVIHEIKKGLRIGIIGLTTPHIPNWEKPEHIEGMIFEDAVISAKKWVSFLREKKGVHFVIVSYHGGFECDLQTGKPTEEINGENQGCQLLQEVKGIDVLLTGHQHRQIARKVNDVAVLQPGSNGIVLGKVTLTFEKNKQSWVCTAKHPELLSVKDVKEDTRLLTKIKTYEDATQKWLDQPIGKIKGDLVVHNPIDIRTKDNALIELINRVQMEAAGVDISLTALFDNNSPGFPEHVTMRDVVSNYIYPNTLKVIRITGKDMKEALERSAEYFQQYDGSGEIKVNPAFTTPKPQHYNYDMWEGIEYFINISKPIGQRIVKLDYKGEAVDPNKEYDVVMNNYRASGGGEYPMYVDKPVIKDIPIDVSELIANYIMENKVVEGTMNNNWKVIYDE